MRRDRPCLLIDRDKVGEGAADIETQPKPVIVPVKSAIARLSPPIEYVRLPRSHTKTFVRNVSQSPNPSLVASIRTPPLACSAVM